MSYTVAYTTDVQQGLRRLDVLLQEDVLDAVDLLADQPDLLPRQSAGGTVVYDFVREIDGIRYYVFLTFRVHHAERHLEFTEVGYFARPVTANGA